MEADVVISNQHNQFCFSRVSEHPVEAPHVVLPVLQTEKQQQHKHTGSAQPLIRQQSSGKLMRVNGISEGHPAAPMGDLALIQSQC